MLSGRGCLIAYGDGSQLLIWMEDSSGEGMANVRGNVGSGILGCGEGGGVVRVRSLRLTVPQ